ncbi:hypothetical protein RFI_24225 [Reticulomyxa filosa]|uniref:Uncharacterized protein n=1 Tax=Reticulomyxa filosa TaxID=46433 RepID=X6MHJ4_RETFI|nr:hypothetical protein RFI_24225 [Reticulomyxa filosa]|eukprot:ETO13151.1 hypothetical protein RFI_24225 [Reticulomyxa filosa]
MKKESLQQELQSSKKATESLKSDITELQNDLQTLKNEKEEVSTQLFQYQVMTQAQQEELNTQNEQMDRKNKSCAAMALQLSTLQSDILTLKEEIIALERIKKEKEYARLMNDGKDSDEKMQVPNVANTSSGCKNCDVFSGEVTNLKIELNLAKTKISMFDQIKKERDDYHCMRFYKSLQKCTHNKHLYLKKFTCERIITNMHIFDVLLLTKKIRKLEDQLKMMQLKMDSLKQKHEEKNNVLESQLGSSVPLSFSSVDCPNDTNENKSKIPADNPVQASTDLEENNCKSLGSSKKRSRTEFEETNEVYLKGDDESYGAPDSKRRKIVLVYVFLLFLGKFEKDDTKKIKKVKHNFSYL